MTLSPAMFDLAEASKRTGLSQRHLRQLVQDGQIAHHRVGRLIKFTEADCDAIVGQFAVKPAGSVRPGRRRAS